MPLEPPIGTFSPHKDRRAVNIDGVDKPRSAFDDAMLSRIAHAFGVVERVFVRATTTGKDVPASLAAVIQTSDLLAAFERIADPATRERCLDYVQAAARLDPKKAT